ncbi:MAG TPA: SUF system Fe-S cluster assembly protein [Tepidisphaeraceae bacterium]|jgi:FeS assembly SUF system protein|nr:SUF system Fe-S cluster assembly protein [Tepidisphaeraceae bacterium]
MSDDYRYPFSLVSLPVLKNGTSPEALQQAIFEPAAPIAILQSESAQADPANAPAPAPTADGFVQQKLIEGKVIEAVREIFDPEIPVNIYELGLIYDIQVNAENHVHVKMTLTAPACPVAGSLPGEVEKKIEAIPEVKSADVELVWEPPWSRDRMSEAALLQLGMF